MCGSTRRDERERDEEEKKDMRDEEAQKRVMRKRGTNMAKGTYLDGNREREAY